MFPHRNVSGVAPIFPQNNIVLEITVLKKIICKFQVRRTATATRTRIVKIMNNVQTEIVFQHVLYNPVKVMPIV